MAQWSSHAQRKQLLFAREQRLEQAEATLDLDLVLRRDLLGGNFAEALQPRAKAPPVILCTRAGRWRESLSAGPSTRHPPQLGYIYTARFLAHACDASGIMSIH